MRKILLFNIIMSYPLYSRTFILLAILLVNVQVKGQINMETEVIKNFTGIPDTAEIMKNLEDWEIILHNPDSALLLYKQTLQESRTMNYIYGITASLIAIGYTYNILGFYEQAIGSYQQAMIYSQQNENAQRLLARIYAHTGQSYGALGDRKKAAQFYLLAIQTIEAIPKSLLKLEAAYIDLTTVIDNPHRGLYYLRKADSLVAVNNHQSRGVIYLNTALQYRKLGDNDNNRHYLQKAYQLGKEYYDSLLQFRTLIKMGSLALTENNPRQALHYVSKAYEVKKSGDFEAYQENSNQLLVGQIYFRLKNYQQAIFYWQEALETAQVLQIKNQVAEAHNNLSLLYATKRDYEMALYHQIAFRKLADSLMNDKIAKDINNLEVEYRTAEKDKLIAQALQETERKNFQIILVAGCALILTGSFFAFYRHTRQKQKMLQQEKEIGQLKNVMKGEEKERKRIAQELHDGIGGMLGAIKMQTSRVRDNPEAVKFNELMHMIDETAGEVRRTSHNLLPGMLEKHTLEEALTLYCDNINNNTALNIEIQFHGATSDLEPSVTLVIYRIAQELIQNVIKHAQATIADVQVMRNGTLLNIIVEDNGVGFNTDFQSKGIGLLNMEHRVQAMRGYMSIDSVEGRSTTIFIEFDLKNLKLEV